MTLHFQSVRAMAEQMITRAGTPIVLFKHKILVPQSSLTCLFSQSAQGDALSCCRVARAVHTSSARARRPASEQPPDQERQVFIHERSDG
jgi:hypothetical protein